MLALGGVWSLGNRYRKSSVVVRTQIRWMLLASVFLVVGFVLMVVTDTDSNLAGVVVALALASIPVSITIAIMKYKLFEIDRIISRTVTYVVIVGSLAAVFAGIVSLSSLAVSTDNGIAVAAATLAAAALFNPLRIRVQRQVDRRFNRTGYRIQTVTDDFATKMQSTHNAEEVTKIWVSTVDRALHPASTSVWLRQRRRFS